VAPSTSSSDPARAPQAGSEGEPTYRAIRFAELADLAASHPQVAALRPGDEHHPSMFGALADCPQIDGDFPCYHYLLEGGAILVSLLTFPDRVTIDGADYPWSWTGSFLTSPAARGRGLGKRLWARATDTLHDAGYVVGGAFANPVTTHICRGFGFTILEPRIPRLLFLKSAEPMLRHHLPRPALVSLVDAPYRLLARGLARVAARGAGGAGMTVELDRDGTAFADRLRGRAPHYDAPCHFDDGVDRFAWKLQQLRGVDVYLISDRTTGEPLARFAVKDRVIEKKLAGKYSGFQLMTLMDYVLYRSGDDTYDRLVDALLALFWDSDALVLETISASPELNRRLRRKLLIPVGQGVAFWYKAPPDLALPATPAQTPSWHFTHFATDAFGFG
jgi:GNAT superfamily N-acetyltransferase